MRRKVGAGVLRQVSFGAFVTCLLAASAGFAQTGQEPTVTPAILPTPVPTPVPASEIPNEAAEIRITLRDAVAATDVSDDLETLTEDFDRERQQLDQLREETLRRIEAGGPASIVKEVEPDWLSSAGLLDGWLGTLKSASTAIEKERQRLEEERRLWKLTLESADEVRLPEVLHQQVEDTLAAIGEAETAVLSNRDAVLTLQYQVAREKVATDEVLELLSEEVIRRGQGIFGADSLPIWKVFAAPGLTRSPADYIEGIWTKNRESIQAHAAASRDRLFKQAGFFVLLTIFLLFLRAHASLWVQQDRSLQAAVDLLTRSVAASFIITFLLSEVFNPGAPRAWENLLGFLLLLALLRMFPILLPESLRRGAYLLPLVYFLQKIADLAPDGNIINRFALLALSLAAAGSSLWFLKKVRNQALDVSQELTRTIAFFAWLVFLAFVAGAIANLVGSVGLATLIIDGTLTSVYAAIMAWVGTILMKAVVRVALLTKFARRFGLVRLHGDTLRQNLFALIDFLALVAWAAMTLRGFGVFDDIWSGLKRILNRPIAIGDFSIVPADILIFVFIVWLTFKISRIVRFGLETDVMPHMDLPRGVPATISRLTHYVIIVIGIIFASSAAGLDFSSISLIIGALGVGIGFGLQNVVNNFVSGLILLFERPIRIGDKIELNDLFGTVKSIGMRASVVSTIEGAEVIVPNANLISSEVINWTLSDNRRRLQVPVGVAYGTDPSVVIDILNRVAGDHPEVLTDPEPEALFLGFGDSALDFELRAWTTENFVAVSSDLRVSIDDAFREQGIEIPFPQRDVHLRSVDTNAAISLSQPEEKDIGEGAE
jgi:small-conductance mechanosensitive channel